MLTTEEVAAIRERFNTEYDPHHGLNKELCKYAASDADFNRLCRWHFHQPLPEMKQRDRYEAIYAATYEVARMLTFYCPPSRQLSLALTKLEEARMWAMAAISCNERAGDAI